MRASPIKLLSCFVFAATVFAGFGNHVLARSSGPSFDCNKAVAPDEKAICADAGLSRLDVLINVAFKAYKPDFRQKKDIARDLNADRHACEQDRDCILIIGANALQTYGTVPPWVESRRSAILTNKARAMGDKMGGDATPSERIGDCSATKIIVLGTRFTEGLAALSDPDEVEGSSVQFENQLSQVSYDREASLAGSRIGDPVMACLASTPRDCPAGDKRGRFYFVLNQRTDATWMLPDSQHMCGGA